MTKQNFIQGTMILVVAGLITRALGTIYRIVLSRYIGAEAIGLYQMAFPTLIMLITIVTAGLPIAVSKLVAEAEANKDEVKVKKILWFALFLVSLIAIMISFVFYFTIPLISRYLLTDERVALSLYAIVPIIPIISISSVLRGYFQGRQNMLPSALSTIIETIFRMISGIAFSLFLLPYGAEYASAGAMVGMVIGEIAGNLVLIIQYHFNRSKEFKKYKLGFSSYFSEKSLGKQISRIAVPVTTSQIIGSIAYFIEPGVVAHSLALAGISTAIATAQYGQLAGMALLVTFFPTVITYSLSVSLVPAVSEAAARKDSYLIYKRLHQALKFAFIIGFPAAALIFILSDSIGILLFDNTQVGHLIKILAPFAIFLYIQRPLAATLQGLDHAKESMKNSIIGAIAKTVAIVFLASRPTLGIDGVAIAINLGMTLVTVLHFNSIVRIIGYSLQLKSLLFIILSTSIVSFLTYHLLHYSFLELHLAFRVLIILILSIIAYFYLLLFFKIIKKQDIERIPWIGVKIARILPIK